MQYCRAMPRVVADGVRDLEGETQGRSWQCLTAVLATAFSLPALAQDKPAHPQDAVWGTHSGCRGQAVAWRGRAALPRASEARLAVSSGSDVGQPATKMRNGIHGPNVLGP